MSIRSKADTSCLQLLGCLVLLFALSACNNLDDQQLVTLDEISTDETAVPDLIERGEAALAAESFKEAEASFQEVLTIDTMNTRAGFGLAETYYEIEEYNRALRLYEGVVKNTSDNDLLARSELGIGLIKFIESELDLGEKHLKRAVVKKPSLWRAWLGLARIHEQKGNSDAARKAYKMAEKHGAEHAVVHNNVGMWHLSSRNTKAAETSFNRALEIDPNLKEASSNIRLVHATDQEYEKAIAGASEEDLPAVLNNVGYIAILNKDFRVAEKYLNQAIALSPFYNTAAIANLQLLKDAQSNVIQGR